MPIDRAARAFAASVLLLGLALARLFNAAWLWLSVFAGLNLIQASFAAFCSAAMVFKRLGCKAGVAFK